MREVEYSQVGCPEEAVVILIERIHNTLASSDSLRERDVPTSWLHCICTVNVHSELDDVVDDVGTVSVVVLIQALPLNRGDE